jgi:hypothetical protein
MLNHENEDKAIKHKDDIPELRKGMDALGTKFDGLNKIVSEIVKNYFQIKQVNAEYMVRY